MSLVALRIEVEHELRAAMASRGTTADTLGIGEMLHQLEPYSAVWERMPQFEAGLRTMNEAVHGLATAS